MFGGFPSEAAADPRAGSCLSRYLFIKFLYGIRGEGYLNAKLINACKNTSRSKDERRSRNAIYFIIIETTLKDNEAPVGWDSLF